MKIVTINGSPRPRAKSKAMEKEIIKRLEADEKIVVEFNLRQMNYKGCVGCYHCKGKGEECILKDDISQALNEIRDCDLLIISSPIYFFDVTSQFKAFLDRTYSFLKPDFMTNPIPSRLPAGKKMIFIQTQGADEKEHNDIFPKLDYFFGAYGFDKRLLIKSSDNKDPNNISIEDELLQKISEVTGGLMG